MEEKQSSRYNKYVTCQLDLDGDCPDPVRCPVCGGNLVRTKHQMSSDLAKRLEKDANIPGWWLFEYGFITTHKYTYVFVCDQCQWWYIREAYSQDDMGGQRIVVIITYGVADMDVKIENGYANAPWENALAKGHLVAFNELSPFPDELRDMFLAAMGETPITQPYE